MQRNRTRQDLKNDTLTSLGWPIVKVNLTDNMLDNIINQAIKKMWRWHVDGTVEMTYAFTITQDNIDTGFVQLPEYVDSVLEVIPQNYGNGGGNFTTPQWQLSAQAVMSGNQFAPINLTDYVAAQMRLTNIRAVLGNNARVFEYSTTQHRLMLKFPFELGEIIALRVYENVDPDRTDPGGVGAGLLFDNESLKELCTAYAKIQWGTVLRRFQGMTLPGGVVINGDDLVQEGKAEEAEVIERLKAETCDLFFMA